MIPIKVLAHGFKLVRATDDASAFDLTTPVDITLTRGCILDVKMGIKSAIPSGKIGLVAPRSGLGSRGVQVRNTVAYMDSDFRGEWELRFTLAEWSSEKSITFPRGSRVAQVCFPTVDTEVSYVDELNETQRGAGGFNSTGTTTEEMQGVWGKLVNCGLPSGTSIIYGYKDAAESKLEVTASYQGSFLKSPSGRRIEVVIDKSAEKHDVSLEELLNIAVEKLGSQWAVHSGA